MEIDEKELKALLEERRIAESRLCVMDSGMNVSLAVDVVDNGTAALHTKRGGIRVMSAQTGLRFVREVLGADEIKVILKNERK